MAKTKLETAYCSLRVLPRSTVAMVGQSIYFNCSTLITSHEIHWYFYPVGAFKDEINFVYGDKEIHPPYTYRLEVDRNYAAGSYNLRIPFVERGDAGRYICLDNGWLGNDSASAELVVLGNDPVCMVSKETIIDGEFLQMECIVNYTGNISPVIKWSRSDGINPESHFNICTDFNNSSVVSKFTRQMTMEDNAVTFMSNIYFDRLSSSSDKSDVHKATNVPDYTFIWTHKANVSYAPKSVNITQEKDVYLIGDILYCVANGNPSPSYEWTELESRNVVSRLSSLTIDNTRMENHVYKCTATNGVYGKETQSISTTVTIHAVRHPTTGITIAAGVVCFILILFVFAFVIRRFKGCLRSFMLRGAEAGPDIIVQNADRDENDRFLADNAQRYIGYAQLDDPTIRRPTFQQREYAVAAREDGSNANCNQGPVLEGFPVYDEINTSQGPTSVREDVKIPLYGRVNKSSKVADQNPSKEEVPVYGKVQKKRDEQPPYPGTSTSKSEAEENEIHKPMDSKSCYTSSLKKVIIGADGTEYMDMSGARSIMQTEAAAAPSAQHPLFNRSHYAQIDHTKSALK